MAKVMISIPDELLLELDQEAKARNTTRSALLALAAIREIRTPDAARIDELLAAARAALADSGSWSAEQVVQEQRASQ